MRSSRGNRCFVNRAMAVLALAMAGSAFSQPARQTPPLPDGYMRAPAVPPGLAPKMTVHESAAPEQVFDVRFSAGDEIMSGLTDLVLEHGIASGYVTGLGGLSGALLAWGDPEVGAFKKISVDEKCELVSLVGHIQTRDGKPAVHLHAVVAFRDGSTKAGHVMEAHVAPLAEVSVVATSVGNVIH
jgi:hypothetical protein